MNTAYIYTTRPTQINRYIFCECRFIDSSWLVGSTRHILPDFVRDTSNNAGNHEHHSLPVVPTGLVGWTQGSVGSSADSHQGKNGRSCDQGSTQDNNIASSPTGPYNRKMYPRCQTSAKDKPSTSTPPNNCPVV